MAGIQTVRTVAEWEAVVGAQVRDLRVRSRLTQLELADASNLSVSTVRALERGHGSSLSSLVAVTRALGRADWLEQLAPPISVSPMAKLREAQAAERSRPQRVRHSKADR